MTTEALASRFGKHQTNRNRSSTDEEGFEDVDGINPRLPDDEDGWSESSEKDEMSVELSGTNTYDKWDGFEHELQGDNRLVNKIDSTFSGCFRSPVGQEITTRSEYSSQERNQSQIDNAIGGRIAPSLSKSHQNWQIDQELQDWCSNDKDLRETIVDAFEGLDDILWEADVTAFVEKDNEEQGNPRPLICATMSVKDAEEWHKMKQIVQEVVMHSQRGDIMVYTTVDRR